jgi:multidrug efflux pump subunit AcrB
VVAVQTYAGTAKPFDFNGMVRHYYLRAKPWQGEIQVQLVHKGQRARSSHEIALQARELLTPLVKKAQARITVVEMPPGPPVLQAVVAEFGNFVTPAVIMAPIPLTLLGIVPGHWVMGAEFTATSMIGFIALAGIIVRNSILLVDFSIEQVRSGVSVTDAVINSCKARTRPILITAFALVAGSSVILTDPIFQGMAVCLLFGVLISTVLTLVVIPLGCVSAGRYLTKE